MTDILICIPTYNEKDNVGPMSATIRQHFPQADLLYIDDASPDGTGALLDELCASESGRYVLHRQSKNGLGPAYLAGFNWALDRPYRHILTMDADFSHDPESLPGMLEMAASADLVVGSRYLGGVRVVNWPRHRLILSRGAGIYTRLLTGMPFSDPTAGFMCFRRELLEALSISKVEANGYSFLIEMKNSAWMQGFCIREHPITFVERQVGESKMNGAIIREAMWVVWKVLFKNHLRRRPPRTPHPQSICAVASESIAR